MLFWTFFFLSSNIANSINCSIFFKNEKPNKWKVPESLEERQIARAAWPQIYNFSRDFSQHWGKQYADLAFSQLDPNAPEGKKLKVIVALGGAEFLGELLEIEAHRRGISDKIEIVPITLNTELMDPWQIRHYPPQRLSTRYRGPFTKGHWSTAKWSK